MKHCLIFSRDIFYFTIVLCLHFLWLKAVIWKILITQPDRYVKCKHGVIKVCTIEYLTTEIELVLPTFKSRPVHKIIEYITLRLMSSLWNIYHSKTAYFFDPLCILSALGEVSCCILGAFCTAIGGSDRLKPIRYATEYRQCQSCSP